MRVDREAFRSRALARFLAAASVLAVAAVGSSGELPEEWRHWTHSRAIEMASDEESRLVRVPLPEELLEAAESDLRDIRVIDDRGRSTGYVLYERGRGASPRWRDAPLLDAGSVTGRYSQVVADTGGEGLLHSAAEVSLGAVEREAFVWIEVALSDDRETWRVVRSRAPLYRFGDVSRPARVRVDYPRTQDRWLRLRVPEDGDPIPIASLRVSETVEEDLELVPLAGSFVPADSSSEGESWWAPVAPPGSVRVTGVRFSTERETFHRGVEVRRSSDGKNWTTVGTGAIYRFDESADTDMDMDPDSERQSMRVRFSEDSAPYWRVAVLDRDDAPIDDLVVAFERNVRHLVFRAESDRGYRLVYGNENAEEPDYEISRLVSRDRQVGAGLAALAEEEANEGWVSSAPLTERHPILLWGALLVAVAVVGGLAVKSLRG